MTAAAKSIERAAVSAVKQALRPVLRLCLRRSIKLMEIFELLKGVLVEIAREELSRQGSEASVSKISVMSGVHRRDVTRLLHAKEGPRTENIISKIIGQWQNDPRFLDSNGKPRELSTKGTNSELFKLVRSVSSDLAPYTILFELERLGLVSSSDGSARLTRRLHLASAGDLSAGYEMFGEDLRDLGEAIDSNLHGSSGKTAEAAKNLHLKTEFSAIPRDKVPQISRWLLLNGSKFHRRVEQYLAKFDRDINKQKHRRDDVRMAYGSFCLTDSDLRNDT